MKSIFDIIKERYSARNYSRRLIEKDKIQKITDYLNENTKGPLGSEVRFEIIDATDYEQAELRKFGTYGLIKGAHVFIAGMVKRNKTAMEDFGYCMEKNIPLDLNTCGEYSKVLEAVRLAPSASNKQPWRIINDQRNVYHLFMQENTAYNNVFKDIKIQNLDMGIAMCHFELAANELGLKGGWEVRTPVLDAGDLKYIVVGCDEYENCYSQWQS